MPAFPASHLAEAVRDAVEQSGASCLTVAHTTQPKRFVITDASGSRSLWLYLWTLTPGGRPSLANEYRIQMTAELPLQMNPDGDTALMGYLPDLQVFAGFDLTAHRESTGHSPSVQIDIDTLRQALQDGLALHRKSNDEIAIGVRPDLFLGYVRNAEALHSAGSDENLVALLKKAAALEPIPPADLSALAPDRRKIVQTVIRHERDGSFKKQVITAYDRRCAVTGIQLRLPEAAHILPVPVKGSMDVVTNGLALTPTYHRAYDRGLIFLDEKLKMQLNRNRIVELKSLGLDGGLDTFSGPLGRKILLPSNPRDWPDLAFVRKANAHRGVA